MLWLIVSTGAVVRLTSSGLGCEHWPGCQPGQPFPEKGYHSYIEFGNRMVGGVTIVLTLALAIGAWFTRGLPRWARWLAVATFVGTLAQAPLGAITVYAHLHPALVIPHLLLSIAVLAAAVSSGWRRSRSAAATTEPLDREPRLAGLWDRRSPASRCSPPGRSRPPPARTRAARTSTGSGACTRRCCCTAPRSPCSACSLMFLIGYLFARRATIGARCAEGAVGLAVLVLVQMALGDIQYRTHLPWGLVLVHVAVAAAVWALTVAFVTLMWRPLGCTRPDVDWSNG